MGWLGTSRVNLVPTGSESLVPPSPAVLEKVRAVRRPAATSLHTCCSRFRSASWLTRELRSSSDRERTTAASSAGTSSLLRVRKLSSSPCRVELRACNRGACLSKNFTPSVSLSRRCCRAQSRKACSVSFRVSFTCVGLAARTSIVITPYVSIGFLSVESGGLRLILINGSSVSG